MLANYNMPKNNVLFITLSVLILVHSESNFPELFYFNNEKHPTGGRALM